MPILLDNKVAITSNRDQKLSQSQSSTRERSTGRKLSSREQLFQDFNARIRENNRQAITRNSVSLKAKRQQRIEQFSDIFGVKDQRCIRKRMIKHLPPHRFYNSLRASNLANMLMLKHFRSDIDIKRTQRQVKEEIQTKIEEHEVRLC